MVPLEPPALSTVNHIDGHWM